MISLCFQQYAVHPSNPMLQTTWAIVHSWSRELEIGSVRVKGTVETLIYNVLYHPLSIIWSGRVLPALLSSHLAFRLQIEKPYSQTHNVSWILNMITASKLSSRCYSLMGRASSEEMYLFSVVIVWTSPLSSHFVWSGITKALCWGGDFGQISFEFSLTFLFPCNTAEG